MRNKRPRENIHTHTYIQNTEREHKYPQASVTWTTSKLASKFARTPHIRNTMMVIKHPQLSPICIDVCVLCTEHQFMTIVREHGRTYTSVNLEQLWVLEFARAVVFVLRMLYNLNIFLDLYIYSNIQYTWWLVYHATSDKQVGGPIPLSALLPTNMNGVWLKLLVLCSSFTPLSFCDQLELYSPPSEEIYIKSSFSTHFHFHIFHTQINIREFTNELYLMMVLSIQ